MEDRLMMFKELTEAHGAPGFEKPVRELMKKYLSQYTKEIIQDNLGGIFGVKRNNEAKLKIMVAGHMDEVGFMVTRITDQGFIKFQTLGGWWSQVLLAQRVSILTEKGEIEGVIGSIPTHLLTEELKSKPFDIKKMFIDIGANNKEDAEKIGIKPGQPIVPATQFKVMSNPKRLLAKAWDNRYGCALAIDLLDSLKDISLPSTLYTGANVQEEVGLRGAKTAAEMINPDIFFALDAGPASDVPGAAPEDAMGKLGEGIFIRLYDRSYVTHKGMREFLLDTVESLGIKYQYFVSQGGTDAGRIHMHGNGVPSIVIGIPSRYIHSHVSIIDYDDYLAARETLSALIKNLNKGVYDTIIKNV